MNASEMQHRFFLNEIKQHTQLPSIRSYLKLYSSVDIAKLADFGGVSKEDFRTRLLALKHKSRMVCWKTGPANSGEEQQGGEVEFFIDKDVIHVSEAKVSQAHHHSEYFIHHIDHLQNVTDEIGKQTVSAMNAMS